MADLNMEAERAAPCPLCDSQQVQVCRDSNNPAKDCARCRECKCTAPLSVWNRRTVPAAPMGEELPVLPEADEYSATRMLHNGELAPRFNGTRLRQYARDAIAPHAERIRQLERELAERKTASITPMCERKTNDIVQRDGYEKTGYVLKKAGERICVSDGGAVAWFTSDQWNWLMFNRDHIEFNWPKPLAYIDGRTAGAAAEEVEPAPTCWCHACNKDRKVGGLPYAMTTMILCPTCGNKRCPKASDHALECTDSNLPGQPGSEFAAAPTPMNSGKEEANADQA